MTLTKGPANSSALVTVTASNSHSARDCRACSIDKARTSSTSFPMSVSKTILTGGRFGGGAASAEQVMTKSNAAKEARNAAVRLNGRMGECFIEVYAGESGAALAQRASPRRHRYAR